MRSITRLDLQYAHRFYGFKGEAQYLHGHTGVLTLEVEDSIEISLGKSDFLISAEHNFLIPVEHSNHSIPSVLEGSS